MKTLASSHSTVISILGKMVKSTTSPVRVSSVPEIWRLETGTEMICKRYIVSGVIQESVNLAELLLDEDEGGPAGHLVALQAGGDGAQQELQPPTRLNRHL